MAAVETVQQQSLQVSTVPLTEDVSNDQIHMLHSFLRLSPTRMDPIEYKADGVEIVVQGLKVESCHDQRQGDPRLHLFYRWPEAWRGKSGKKFRFTAHDFFSVTGKTPGGARPILYSQSALERLQKSSDQD